MRLCVCTLNLNWTKMTLLYSKASLDLNLLVEKYFPWRNCLRKKSPPKLIPNYFRPGQFNQIVRSAHYFLSSLMLIIGKVSLSRVRIALQG